jgi:hypothetical protein
LTWLIVGRAISNVDGFDVQIPSPKGVVRFRSNWGSFRLQKRNTFDEGSWELVAESGGDKDSTLVIALACQLLQGTSTDVRSRLNRTVNQIDRNKFKQILICFPGTISDADSYSEIEELASLLNPISSRLVDDSRNIWLVPISPLDIESTERVERVVRWTSGRFASSISSQNPNFKSRLRLCGGNGVCIDIEEWKCTCGVTSHESKRISSI